MAGENEAVTLLRYRTDNASVNAAVQANQKVAASYKNLQAAAATFSPDTLRLNPQLLATQSAITGEMQRQLPLAERLAEAAKVRAAAEQGTIAGLRSDAFGGGVTEAGGRGGRTLGQNVTKAGRDLFNLPDVGGSTTISRLLILGGAVIDKLGVSVSQIGAAAGIAAPAVIGVAIALDRFNQGLADSKKLLEGALAAQSNYFDALREFTSDQAKTEIEELERIRPALEAEALEARGALDSAFAQLQANHGDASARLLIESEAFAPLRDAATEAEAALAENVHTTTRLTQGLEENAFQANDLRAAYEALTKEQLQGVDRILHANSLTEEQRNERIREATNEIEILEALKNEEGQTAAATQELRLRQAELRDEIETLTGVSESYADVIEREQAAKEALTERNDAYLDLIEREIEAREEAFAIQEKILAIEAERDERIREIEADRDERLLELTGDAEERRIEIIEDAADRIAKIERDANRARADAIANRDALAFHQAEIRRKDALDDQQTALDKSLKQVTKNLEKQERALEKSYRKQLDNVIDSSNKQLQVQYNALTQANFLIQSALTAQNAHVQSGFQLMVGGTAEGMLLMQNIVVTGFMNMVNAVQGIFAGGGSQFPPVGGGTGGGNIGAFGARRFIRQEVTNQLYSYFRAANPAGARL